MHKNIADIGCYEDESEVFLCCRSLSNKVSLTCAALRTAARPAKLAGATELPLEPCEEQQQHLMLAAGQRGCVLLSPPGHF